MRVSGHKDPAVQSVYRSLSVSVTLWVSQSHQLSAVYPLYVCHITLRHLTLTLSVNCLPH